MELDPIEPPVQIVLSPQYPDFQQTLLRNAGLQTWASNREIGSKAPPSVHNSLFIITLKWVWQKYTFFSWCNWYGHILNHWWSCFCKSLILPPSALAPAPIHLNEMRKPWLMHFDLRNCKKYCIKNAKNICEKSQKYLESLKVPTMAQCVCSFCIQMTVLKCHFQMAVPLD